MPASPTSESPLGAPILHSRVAKLPVWPVYVLVALLIAFHLTAGYLLLFAMWGWWHVGVHTDSLRTFYWGVVALLRQPLGLMSYWAVGELAFLALLLPFLAASPVPLRRGLGLASPRASVTTIVVLAVGAVAAAHVIQLPFNLAHATSRAALGFYVVEKTIAGLPLAVALFVIVVSFIGPCVEELIFRGFIQTRLIKRHGPLVGILVTSILFGVCHLDWMQSSTAAIMGLWLGAIAWRTQSILPSCIAHASVNGVYCAMSLCHAGMQLEIIAVIASFPIVFAAGYLLWKFPKPPALSPYNPGLGEVV